MRLVSACLLGINCRYDGKNCLEKKVIQLFLREVLIPICPEQLGGFPTPREPIEIVGGDGSEVLDGKAKVFDGFGRDVTKNLVKGANEVLKIAKKYADQFKVKDILMASTTGMTAEKAIHIMKNRIMK